MDEGWQIHKETSRGRNGVGDTGVRSVYDSATAPSCADALVYGKGAFSATTTVAQTVVED